MIIMGERFLKRFYLIYKEIFYNKNSNHHNHSFDVNEKILSIDFANNSSPFYKRKIH
jgi:hypothetical protein